MGCAMCTGISTGDDGMLLCRVIARALLSAICTSDCTLRTLLIISHTLVMLTGTDVHSVGDFGPIAMISRAARATLGARMQHQGTVIKCGKYRGCELVFRRDFLTVSFPTMLSSSPGHPAKRVKLSL